MKYFFIIITLFFIGCNVQKQLNNQWIGKSDNEVVREFGIPDSVFSTFNYSKIYQYNFITENDYIQSLKFEKVTQTPNSKPLTIMLNKKLIYFNSNDKVVLFDYFDTSFISNKYFQGRMKG